MTGQATKVATRVLRADDAAIAEAARVLAAASSSPFRPRRSTGSAPTPEARRWRGIYAAKGRPAFNPLIAHVSISPRRARWRLLEGGRAAGASLLAGTADAGFPHAGMHGRRSRPAGLDSVALRVPASSGGARAPRPPRPRRRRAVGQPLRPGLPDHCRHVLADLDGRIDLILDGGATPVGVESTIVACLDAARAAAPGRPVARGDRRRAWPALAGAPANAPADAPSRARHARLALRAARHAAARCRGRDGRRSRARLGRDGLRRRKAVNVLDLSARAARRSGRQSLCLFARARRRGAAAIAVAPIPDDGLGEAINDRLRRAAAPR